MYSKKRILTRYSIQIAYTEMEVELWKIKNKIKILNNWKVAIDPGCLNTLSKMLMEHTKITAVISVFLRLLF